MAYKYRHIIELARCYCQRFRLAGNLLGASTFRPSSGSISVMRIPPHPTIYEINTAVFLGDLSRRHKRKITFATVPAEVWDTIADLPIDAIWFMGIWQHSPLARQMADENPELKRALPDLQPEDILGSAYSIYDYVVDERFGGDAALAVARAELAKRGVGPNSRLCAKPRGA